MASPVGMRRLGGVDGTEFEILVDTSGPGRRIAVRGDLDLATVDSLRPALDEALEAGESTTLELSQCTFLDSSALKAIADASRRAGETGVAFTVARPSPQAARVLEVSGLDEIVGIDAGEYP
jgi:anti-sigma B factor antagonist